MNDASLYNDSSFQMMTAEKKYRLTVLKKILAKSRKVFLIHGDDPAEYEVEEAFKTYLEKLASPLHSRIEFMNMDVCEDIFPKDVIFPLVLDFHKLCAFLNVINAKLSVLQVFLPTIFYFPFLIEKRGFIIRPDVNEFQLPFLATIDTVNVCNLDCATCTKPSWQESGERMSFELFKRILDKLQLMGIKAVELYNFSEPFLNPEIYDFMAEVKRRGLTLGISSNLARPHIPKLKQCVDLLEPGDWFVITISGINQNVYEINHKRGKISDVIDNIKEISASDKRSIVRLRLLKFGYNDGELEAARNLAKKYGLSFEWFPAVGDPINKPYSGRNLKKKLIDSGISYTSYDQSFYNDGFYCFFIHSRNIIINHKGNVELCCVQIHRPYDLGSFLEQDISVIQMKRDIHPSCKNCAYHGSDESKALTKMFPVDPQRASNILAHAMNTLNLQRRLSPKAFFNDIKSTKDFLDIAVKYFDA